MAGQTGMIVAGQFTYYYYTHDIEALFWDCLIWIKYGNRTQSSSTDLTYYSDHKRSVYRRFALGKHSTTYEISCNLIGWYDPASVKALRANERIVIDKVFQSLDATIIKCIKYYPIPIEEDELKRKYILWLDYGHEGWSPTGFNSLTDAIEAPKYGQQFVITSGKIDYKVIESSN